MVGIPWEHAFALDDSAGLDGLAVSVHQQWRFLNLQPGTVVELRALGDRRRVALCDHLQDAIRLAREADAFADATGVYMIPSRISDEAASRYPLNRWHPATAGCVGKSDVTHRRALYIDCDAERASGTNATDAEKACAVRLADRIEGWLSKRLDSRCIGRGDSGTGATFFVALDPAPCSEETDTAIAEFLRRAAATFVEPGAKVDTAVWNPDRLVPLFGTRKRKAPHSADRPQRQTAFGCRAPVVRIPLERIV